MVRFAAICAAGLILVVLTPTPAGAATLYVNSCGSDDWSGAASDCSLDDGPKEHIQAAINSASDGDEIIVAAGTYAEAIDFQGKAVYLHSSDGPDNTSIDATGLSAPAVTCAHSEAADTILDGFTVIGGSGRRSSGPHFGGGMYNSASSPTIQNCTFNHNQVGDDTNAGFGGGMYNTNAGPTITNCTFAQNSAPHDGGGAIANWQSTPTISNCTFSHNSADEGGAIYGLGSGTLTITGCTFQSNSATEFGGGLYASYDCEPSITDCTFDHNDADEGGAIYAVTPLSPTLLRCAFTNNSANEGGAISFLFVDGIVSECLFYKNSAKLGGALFLSGAAPAISNCTWSRNSASSSGGGVYVQTGATTLVNCILWDDSPDEIHGTSIAITYSDVSGGFNGTGNINTDPLFVAQSSADLHLEAGSPCIDAGDNSGVPDGETTDIDGNPRFVDDPDTVDTGHGKAPIVDMGALEFQSSAPSCVRGDSNGDEIVNFADIDCFVSALIGQDSWTICGTTLPPDQFICVNDINQDSAVDFNDIDGFVDCLINNGC